MKLRKTLSTLLILFSSVMLGACQATSVHKEAVHEEAPPAHEAQPAPVSHEHENLMIEEEKEPESKGFVLDLRNIPTMDDIVPELFRARVVFVGEAHTSYGHHLSQLDIIRRLHELDADIAIGLEFFQQPYQQYLDGYIAGEIDEQEMLLKTEYYDRWVYDYRLYQPILTYAKEHGIPLVALNVPKEITRKVAKEGMEGLSEEEKAQVPEELDDSDEAYRNRMKRIFELHPHTETQDFERFLQVQLLWDEGMAERAVDYLQEHPEKNMVVLAGAGHLINGSGIPRRVVRRLPMESAIVLPWDGMDFAPGMSDFLIFPEKAHLPPRGYMGVVLTDKGEEPGVEIESLVPNGAAAKAGIKQGDRVLSIDGQAMNSVAEIKIALLNKKPADKLNVEIYRKRFLLSDQELKYELELGH